MLFEPENVVFVKRNCKILNIKTNKIHYFYHAFAESQSLIPHFRLRFAHSHSLIPQFVIFLVVQSHYLIPHYFYSHSFSSNKVGIKTVSSIRILLHLQISVSYIILLILLNLREAIFEIRIFIRIGPFSHYILIVKE